MPKNKKNKNQKPKKYQHVINFQPTLSVEIPTEHNEKPKVNINIVNLPSATITKAEDKVVTKDAAGDIDDHSICNLTESLSILSTESYESKEIFQLSNSLAKEICSTSINLTEKISLPLNSLAKEVCPPSNNLIEKISPPLNSLAKEVDPPSNNLTERISPPLNSLTKELGPPSNNLTERISPPLNSLAKEEGSPSNNVTEKISPPLANSVKETFQTPNNLANYTINFEITPTMEMGFLPKRPDNGGTKGQTIDLIINCLDMKINPMKIFMYDMELIKAEIHHSEEKIQDVTLRIKRKEILRNVLSHFLKDKGGQPLFDGGRIIFTNKLLPYKDDINSIKFPYTHDNQVVVCHFTLQHISNNDINLNEINEYIKSGKGQSNKMPQEVIKVLDMIIREMFLTKNFIPIGYKAIFDPKTSAPITKGPFVIIDGYSATIRPHMSKIRFNFDKTQIVCHQPLNLLDYIKKLFDLRDFNMNNIRKINQKLHQMKVRADYYKNAEGQQYSRSFTIKGVFKKTAETEFIEDVNLSVYDYFLTKHNITLKYPNLLLVEMTNRNKFPVEVLFILPNQKVLGNDPEIVRDVIKYSAVPCLQRLSNLEKAIKTFNNFRDDNYLSNYKIEIMPSLINVQGRILGEPTALFGGKEEKLPKAKFNLANKRFKNPYKESILWVSFPFGSKKEYDEKYLYDLEDELPIAAKKLNVSIQKCFSFSYVTLENVREKVHNILEKLKMEQKQLDLLVFVIRDDKEYKLVKEMGDTDFGIVTQCINYANFKRQRNVSQYMGNLLLKINAKLGGINWELKDIEFTPIKDSFMVFGIDVTHPSSVGRNDLNKSIAAMVGSINKNASVYSATIREQLSKNGKDTIEIVLEMQDMVYQLIKNFSDLNNSRLPKHLIFYRDGVSEGQFEIVFRHEVSAIRYACEALEKDYQPKITYVVVQKRHKIRFFPKNPNEGIGNSKNVPAGVIVDNNITHSREFDFFLCSHEGIQGTSKPVHYHVLYDENKWKSDDLHHFTYYLCYICFRCTRSISYPAPTYYAHLAAFRGRVLKGDNDNISITEESSNLDTSEIAINEFHQHKMFFI